MKILESDNFIKQSKKLFKKYKLNGDFEILKSAILTEPKGDGTKHWNILKKDEEKFIFKVRMSSRYLRKSSFRVIYFYDGKKIVFLSFYYIILKGIKKEKIKSWLKIFEN